VMHFEARYWSIDQLLQQTDGIKSHWGGQRP
jgi:hypothetical protein